jgi:hypothetical protein
MGKSLRATTIMIILLAAALPGAAARRGQERRTGPALAGLVPAVEGWKEGEERRSFFPESLFEYIDGAAESYLSYDFEELLVVQFVKPGTEANLTLEIYDMGSNRNAFGIFSAERYPENKPVEVGDLGYAENEALNFTVGRYYVKILSFGLEGDPVAAAADFANRLAGAVKDKGRLPPLLAAFPRANLVSQSEKYIKKNFMGHAFLHDGYVATYKLDGQELEAFLVEAASEKEAGEMFESLLDFYLKDRLIPEKVAVGYHVRNRYSQHTYFGRTKNLIYGVTRVPDGLEARAEAIAAGLAASLDGARAASPAGR